MAISDSDRSRTTTGTADRARLAALLEVVLDAANSDFGKVRFSMNTHRQGGY